jgi:hypothetical protein
VCVYVCVCVFNLIDAKIGWIIQKTKCLDHNFSPVNE